MTTFKAVILTGKHHTKTDGSTNIKIRVIHNRKTFYISTDLYILPGNFNNSTGQAERGPNKEHINISITQKLLEYRKTAFQIGDYKQSLNISELKEVLLSGVKTNANIYLFDYIEILINKTYNKGTAEQYNNLQNSLKKFKPVRLPFSVITLNFLHNYERWLRDNGVKNGVVNYMVTLRAIFNKARDYYNNEESGHILIPHYPFKKYKMPRRNVKSKEHVLTVAEMKTLLQYLPVNPGEQFAKDMFLLMFLLMGIEAKDLFYLQKPKQGRANYTRYKTNSEFSVKLEPEAIEIIDRYKGSKYLLNVAERFEHHKSFYRYINNYIMGEKPHNITGILQRLGIDKPVTTKWARHTWATIARNECEIDKNNVALCLGHADNDNRVTDMYIKYDYSIQDKSNRKVIDYVFSQKANK